MSTATVSKFQIVDSHKKKMDFTNRSMCKSVCAVNIIRKKSFKFDISCLGAAIRPERIFFLSIFLLL